MGWLYIPHKSAVSINEKMGKKTLCTYIYSPYFPYHTLIPGKNHCSPSQSHFPPFLWALPGQHIFLLFFARKGRVLERALRTTKPWFWSWTCHSSCSGICKAKVLVWWVAKTIVSNINLQKRVVSEGVPSRFRTQDLICVIDEWVFEVLMALSSHWAFLSSELIEVQQSLVLVMRCILRLTQESWLLELKPHPRPESMNQPSNSHEFSHFPKPHSSIFLARIMTKMRDWGIGTCVQALQLPFCLIPIPDTGQ
jgi:hypothetical protein